MAPAAARSSVEALTDNRNRTATNVRTAFSKNGGNLGASGSVAHGFERLGFILYPADTGSENKVLEAAMEAGAEDITSTEDGHEIWTAADDLHQVAADLEKALGEAETVKLAWKPNLTVDMNEGDAATLLKLIDALDDDDDVQTVWGNYDISDEVMEKVEGDVVYNRQGSARRGDDCGDSGIGQAPADSGLVGSFIAACVESSGE